MSGNLITPGRIHQKCNRCVGCYADLKRQRIDRGDTLLIMPDSLIHLADYHLFRIKHHNRVLFCLIAVAQSDECIIHRMFCIT